MKKYLLICAVIFSTILSAGPVIIKNDALPGAEEDAQWYKKTKMSAVVPESGTLFFWVRPDRWDAKDAGAYGVASLGDRKKKDVPGFEFLRLPNGNLQILWFRDVDKKQLDHTIVTSPQLPAGQWSSIALTWQSNGKSTTTTMWINGKKAGGRWLNFVWGGSSTAKQWTFNFSLGWSGRLPAGKVAFGKTMLLDRVLSEEEIKDLAQEKVLSGNRAYSDRNFLPDTENSVTGELVNPNFGAKMIVELVDEAQQVQKKMEFDLGSKNTFTVKFSTLSDTQAVNFTLQANNGKFPAWRISKIDRDPGLPKFQPNYWQASWISADTPAGTPPRQKSYLYYIKEFEIDLSQVAKASCQYIGSNNGTAYINGTDLGRTYGWATPKAVDDVLPLLRNGKNIFAGDAYIPRNDPPFMGELTLIMKDGSVRYIGSGTDWRFSDKVTKGWNTPEYDHSNWRFAVCVTRPPQLPYGETRYRNYAPVPQIEFSGLPLKWQATAGSSITFDLKTPLAKLAPGSNVWLKLMKGENEFYRMPLKLNCSGGTLQLTGKLNIPQVALGDTYSVQLESRNMSFPESIGELKITSNTAKLPELVAEVKNINGTPVLHLNGKAIPALLQRSAINVRNNTTCYRFTAGLDREGVRLVEVNMYLPRLWKADGSINTEELDLYLQAALFYAPNSHLVVVFNTDAPEWYLKKYPGEKYVANTGVINKISYASTQYRNDSVAFFKRVLEYIKSRPYYHRIAGIGMDGGDDGQFMQWAGLSREYLGDYSEPMKKYFHAFLQKKYGTIAKLNSEWQTEYADFSAIAIPSMERRRGDNKHLILDPVKDADIIDFNRAFSSCVADFICEYAKTAKEVTNRTRITTAYYGKVFSIYGILQYGEFDIERILANPDFDYLIAVDYFARPAGKPHELVVPPASYRKHNKIFVDEADIRTYINGASKWAKTNTLFEFTSQARKMFIKSWVNGMGLHWYDLHGGMFENAGLHRSIGNIQKIGEINPARKVVPAEIALIADVKTQLYCTYAWRYKYQPRQASAFGHIGAPYDVWLLNDLGTPGFPEYKMYVFLNALAPTPEQRKAIEALKRDGKMLVFLYNSGYIDGKSASVDNVTKLTGIKMAESGPLKLSMRFAPGEGGKLFSNVNKTLYTSTGEADTAAVAVDPTAESIGSFIGNEKYKPMAYKKFANWQSFYCTVGLLPLDLWRELARKAGVHFYVDNDPDCIVYIGSDLLGVHSGNGGRKTLNFPEAYTFIDAVTGETVAVKTKTPEIDIVPGDTRIFRMIK